MQKKVGTYTLTYTPTLALPGPGKRKPLQLRRLREWSQPGSNRRPLACKAVDDQPPATETRHFIGLSVFLQLSATVSNRGVWHCFWHCLGSAMAANPPD